MTFDEQWLEEYYRRQGKANPYKEDIDSGSAVVENIRRIAASSYGETESGAQCAVMTWALYAEGKYPDLKYLHHIPNGGLRHPAVAAKLKVEGVKPGVPDLCLPVPRGNYIGLYIEMKVGANKTTTDQDWWLAHLSHLGHKTAVCYGSTSAIEVLEEYLTQDS